MENRNNEMNVNEIIKNATELTVSKDTETTDIVGGDWMSQMEKPNIDILDPEEEINGIIVNNSDLVEKEETNMINNGFISPQTEENLANYFKDMDLQIQTLKKTKEVETEKTNAPDTTIIDEVIEKDDEEKADQLQKAYDEAIVIIDKSGMGSVIDFTDAEREKLIRAKTIKLQEVETIELKTIKTKKAKKANLDNILKRQSSIYTTPIVLPASGYTATIKGCSAYELVELVDDSNGNPVLSTTKKWSLIYDKLCDTSLGKMDYNTFLQNTAAADYNIFLYGILCATYPDDDTIPLKCTNKDKNCNKEFDHKYSIKSLLRVEKMSEKMREVVANTVDNSFMEQSAKMHHEQSPVNLTQTIKLPVSGFIVKVYVQSAYDFINRSIKELSENTDEKYNNASLLSTIIDVILVPDPDCKDEYFEYDNALDITKIIYSLSETDILVLTKQGEVFLNDLSFEFGIKDAVCPHCGNVTPIIPLDLDSILFFKLDQVKTTRIE
jgi:hypothetical protein